MFQAQNRETTNNTWKVAVSFKIIMTTSVTRPCSTTQHQTCKTNTKTDFFLSETGLVLRPTVSDHITGSAWLITIACRGRLIPLTIVLNPALITVCTCPLRPTLAQSGVKAESTHGQPVNTTTDYLFIDFSMICIIFWVSTQFLSTVEPKTFLGRKKCQHVLFALYYFKNVRRRQLCAKISITSAHWESWSINH